MKDSPRQYQIQHFTKQRTEVRELHILINQNGITSSQRYTNFSDSYFTKNPNYESWLIFFYKRMKGIDQRTEISPNEEDAAREASVISNLLSQNQTISKDQAYFLDFYLERENRNRLPFLYEVQRTNIGLSGLNIYKVISFKKDGFNSLYNISYTEATYNNKEEIDEQFATAKEKLLENYPETKIPYHQKTILSPQEKEEIKAAEMNVAESIRNRIDMGRSPSEVEVKFLVAYIERENQEKLSKAFGEKTDKYQIITRGAGSFLLDSKGNEINLRPYMIDYRMSNGDNLIQLNSLISGRNLHVYESLPDQYNMTILRLIEADIKRGEAVTLGDAILLSSYYALGGRSLVAEEKEQDTLKLDSVEKETPITPKGSDHEHLELLSISPSSSFRVSGGAASQFKVMFIDNYELGSRGQQI